MGDGSRDEFEVCLRFVARVLVYYGRICACERLSSLDWEMVAGLGLNF